MQEPFDGFVIYKCLDGIDYIDLNNGYGYDGIQSDPDKTFLHPELNKRFLHNIGPGGKSKYATWETYADQDEYFKMLNGSPEITPEEIQEIRQKLIDIRNKS